MYYITIMTIFYGGEDLPEFRPRLVLGHSAVPGDVIWNKKKTYSDNPTLTLTDFRKTLAALVVFLDPLILFCCYTDTARGRLSAANTLGRAEDAARVLYGGWTLNAKQLFSFT